MSAAGPTTARPHVVVLVPSDLQDRSFGHAAVSALEAFARVTCNPHARAAER